MEQGLSHAYILAAPPTEGDAAARALAQKLLCSAPGPRPCGVCGNCRKAAKGIHPDILTVSRQTDDKGKPRREIYVEQIRQLVADAAILPNEADKKVYIIREAGCMNAAAQNALLKILEEPPAFVAFILVTDTPRLLLETVRSRCVQLYLGGQAEQPPAEAVALARRWLDIAGHRDAAALLHFAAEVGELGNAELRDFVQAAREALCDGLCGRTKPAGLDHRALLRLDALMKTAAEYLRFNVSPKQLSGLLAVETYTKEQ